MPNFQYIVDIFFNQSTLWSGILQFFLHLHISKANKTSLLMSWMHSGKQILLISALFITFWSRHTGAGSLCVSSWTRFCLFTLRWKVSQRCHHLTKKKKKEKKNPRPYKEPGAWESRAWMSRSEGATVQACRTETRGKSPSTLGFEVSGCKCVHGACIRFNKWLGCHANANVHVYKKKKKKTRGHRCVQIIVSLHHKLIRIAFSRWNWRRKKKKKEEGKNSSGAVPQCYRPWHQWYLQCHLIYDSFLWPRLIRVYVGLALDLIKHEL